MNRSLAALVFLTFPVLYASPARADGDNGPSKGLMVPSLGGQCYGGPYHPPQESMPSDDDPLCASIPRATPKTTIDNCRCADYGGHFPAGVFDSGGDTGCGGLFGCESAGSNEYPGCNATTIAADPHCSYSAEASGFVGGYDEGVEGDEGDGDIDIDVCPDRQLTVVGNRTELRDESNWNLSVQGALHVEVQNCRFFGGSYQIVLPEGNTLGQPAGQPHTFQARPAFGDMISVYGNWIGDIGHHNFWGRVNPHAEIHEAHAIAVTHSVSPTVSYSFVNANFVAEWDEDYMEFDVEVPPSPDSKLSLSCTFDSTAVQTPTIPQQGSAFAWAAAGLGHYCHVFILRDQSVPPLPYGCHQAWECTDTSGNPLTWSQLGTFAYPQIFFSRALRAEWVTPPPHPTGGCTTSSARTSDEYATTVGLAMVGLAGLARRRARRRGR